MVFCEILSRIDHGACICVGGVGCIGWPPMSFSSDLS